MRTISTERLLLAAIFFLYLGLGTIYALTTPIFEASDELWHYPMIEHLADGNPLPVQDPANVGPWRQEASQPPLYYYLGAALTFWIDTSDMQAVRWLNPHVDNGVITPDRNINLAIHDLDWNRWQGTLLAVSLVRFMSVLMGAGTIYFTYRIARTVAPQMPAVYLGAMALNAFLPMFLFISGAVNNDNLAMLLASAGLFLLIAIIRSADTEPVSLWDVNQNRRWLIFGVIAGLAALTKQGALALLPLGWGTMFVSEWQSRHRPGQLRDLFLIFLRSLLRYLWVLLPALLIAGWWYARNVRLYGDLLGWSAFFEVLGVRSQPASLAQLWDERWGFLLSYWGLFGGVNVPMPEWIYHLFNGILLAAIAGFFMAVWGRFRTFLQQESHADGSGLSLFLFRTLQLVEREFPLVICLLLSAAVLYGLVQWATTTWSSQGRLVFTAISALSTLFAVGLAGLTRWVPARVGSYFVAIVAAVFFLVSAAAPFLVIQPAYALPATDQQAQLSPQSMDFGEEMRLVSYRLDDTSLQPGANLDVWITWQALAHSERNWSVFVHLNDPVIGVPVSQRDMYLGQGLLPTSLLEPGDTVENYYRLRVPETTPAPAELELLAGLYDYYTEERLTANDGRSALTLATIQVEATPGEIPNPLSVNFGDALELVGSSVDSRVVNAGDGLAVTLYWKALDDLDEDYTFFAQVLGAENHRWASADVAGPGGTSSWMTGEVQEVVMPLSLDPETPQGVLPLIVGAYVRSDEGGFDRLQVVTPDGRITQENLIQLTQIRVE